MGDSPNYKTFMQAYRQSCNVKVTFSKANSSKSGRPEGSSEQENRDLGLGPL